jgi:hypothetical protein
MSVTMVRDLVRRATKALVPVHPEFADIRFSPHDFRRLFATDLVNDGLPIHIGAALMGHLNVQTTRGYVAVFDEDVVRHYQEFLDRRRAQRHSVPTLGAGPDQHHLFGHPWAVDIVHRRAATWVHRSRPGTGSASAARQGGAWKGSAKYWVSCVIRPSVNTRTPRSCSGALIC